MYAQALNAPEEGTFIEDASSKDAVRAANFQARIDAVGGFLFRSHVKSPTQNEINQAACFAAGWKNNA